MFFTRKILVPVGVAALLATGGAAFLAQNSAPASGQGVSSSPIDGYYISAIHYNVDPPPPPPGGGAPGPMAVTWVSFDASVATAGELPAAQGFVRLDPPGPPPPPWTQCTLENVSGGTSSFTCMLTPGVPVNGPGGSPVGVLSNLEIEVNQ